MTYNGIPLPIRVLKVRGRGLVNKETTTVTIPSRDSSYYVRKRLPDKPLEVDYIIETDGLEDIRNKMDQLNAILLEGEVVPVTFSDEPDITYYAYLNGETDDDEHYFITRGTIPFMRNPYKYKPEKTITDDTGTITVNNDGARNKNLIITATFSASETDYKITKNSTGEFVRVIFDFSAGDILELDFKKRKVTINGNIRMTSLDFSSNWFDLNNGANTLVIDNPSSSASTLKYNPRFT